MHNRLLPYQDHGLDLESRDFFVSIKTNLARSLLLGDIRPGFVSWVARLSKYEEYTTLLTSENLLLHFSNKFFVRYIRFYGLKFPKSDHVELIQLFFSFCTQPELEPWLVNKGASVLITLIKKRDLLNR